MDKVFYVKPTNWPHEVIVRGDDCQWVCNVFCIMDKDTDTLAQFHQGIDYWYFEKSEEYDNVIEEC